MKQTNKQRTGIYGNAVFNKLNFWLLVSLFFLIVSSFSSLAIADCKAPDGSSIPIEQTVHYFRTEFRPPGGNCDSIPLICRAGGYLEVDNNYPGTRNIASVTQAQINEYKYISCLNEARCENPVTPGEYVVAGESIEAYESIDGPCVKEQRVCDGATGLLSGSFTHEQCVEPKS